MLSFKVKLWGVASLLGLAILLLLLSTGSVQTKVVIVAITLLVGIGGGMLLAFSLSDKQDSESP